MKKDYEYEIKKLGGAIKRMQEEFNKKTAEQELFNAGIKKMLTDYIVVQGRLKCPICGAKAKVDIDCFGNVIRDVDFSTGDIEYEVSLYPEPFYTVKCEKGCINIRDENIRTAIAKFKRIEVREGVSKPAKE